MKHAWWLVTVAALLSACAEQTQTLGAGKQDAPPYSGTGMPYVEPGWKPGDKASWESQLKARTQRGQNDYSRMN